MSKREKRNAGEDGFATALKLFGTVATVAAAGYHAVKTIRATSMQTDGRPQGLESVPFYLKSQILSDGSGNITNSKSTSTDEKKEVTYTMRDLEILKQQYAEENRVASQNGNFHRQRWLIDTLELLESIIKGRQEVRKRLELGDFSQSSSQLEKLHQQLHQRLQKDRSTLGEFGSQGLQGEGGNPGFFRSLGASIGLHTHQGSGVNLEDRSFIAKTTEYRYERKRQMEETNESKASDDRKRSLRPRSTKIRRQSAPPAEVEVQSPLRPGQRLENEQPRASLDLEDQSISSSTSLRKTFAEAQAASQSKTPSSTASAQGRKKSFKTKGLSGGRSSAALRSHQHRLHPNDLVGLSVSVPESDVQGKIIEANIDGIDDVENHLELARFKVKVGDKIIEKSYEEVDNNIAWPIKDIIDHEGPLSPKDDNYKDCLYNVKVVWGRCGTSCFDPTWESLHTIADGDPGSCAKYARKKGLLNVKGWEFLKAADEQEDEDASSASSQSAFTCEESHTHDEEVEGEDWDGNIAIAVSQESTMHAMDFTITGREYEEVDSGV